MDNEILDVNFHDIELSQVIDLDFLQRLQDNFADAIGVASITVDMEGNPVTKPSNFTRFCMDLTRTTDEGLKRCMKCDAQGGKMASESGKPTLYECHAGLVDFAAPIMLEGRQIGSIIGGQVLTEEPNEEKFRSIAREIGIDEYEYLDAIKEIEPVSRKRIEKAADLLYMVAKNISEMGYRRYKINRVVEVLNDNLDQIASTMEELAASAIEVSETQNLLTKEIDNVNNLSARINHFIGFIKNIADDTGLLGLNASIEAAKAKEAGRGFSVVAKQIRKLSEDSKETVLKINKFTTSIEESVKKTVEISENTLTTSEQQADAVQEVAASVQALSDVAHQLSDLAK
ncbi:MAG: PocR ligand-binding domain-containing protein [Maledivibacter sp.]|nr:PocR ligand-binding domain-containing protein [Maledivibacter sp.]